MGDVGERFQTESGESGLDRSVASDEFGMGGRDAERGGAADVLARQMDGAEVQPHDEFAQVLRRGRAAVLRPGRGGVTKTAKVDGEDPVPPVPPAVRELDASRAKLQPLRSLRLIRWPTRRRWWRPGAGVLPRPGGASMSFVK